MILKKECRIICGTTYESKEGTTKDVNLEAFYAFEDGLVEIFGGYTMTLGVGAWLSPEGKVIREQVRIYDVAISEKNNDFLVLLAKRLCVSANQHAVYFRNTDGVVSNVSYA